MKREFSVIIEKDSDGYLVASVPELRGCHTQAKSMDELLERVREAALLCLEEENFDNENEFLGIQRLVVDDIWHAHHA
jgi:predicted RNase H-like HicB family nuclease